MSEPTAAQNAEQEKQLLAALETLLEASAEAPTASDDQAID